MATNNYTLYTLHQVAEGDQFLPEWSNPNGTLLDKEVAEVD